MRVLHRAAITLAFALPFSTMPLAAQRYHWDFGVNAGFSWMASHLLRRDDFNFITNDVIIDDINFDNDVDLDNGFTAGSTLGYWFDAKHFGVRANFAWANSGFEGRRNIFPIVGTVFDPFELIDRDLNTFSLTGDLMFRFTKPRERWDGFEFLPYVAG